LTEKVSYSFRKTLDNTHILPKNLECRCFSKHCKFTRLLVITEQDKNFTKFLREWGRNIYSHTNTTTLWKYLCIHCPSFLKNIISMYFCINNLLIFSYEWTLKNSNSHFAQNITNFCLKLFNWPRSFGKIFSLSQHET